MFEPCLCLGICSCHDCGVWGGRRGLGAILGPALTGSIVNDLHSFIPKPVKGNWVTAERRIGNLLPGLKHIQQAQLWTANVAPIVTYNQLLTV